MNIYFDQFSERERDTIKQLLQGKSNKQIALELGISDRTVEFHLKNIYTKLQVSSRTEAILKLVKSPGFARIDELEESTVDGMGETVDNGGKPISTRRISMKNILYITVASLLILVLIFVFVSVAKPVNPINGEPVAQANVTSFVQQYTETTVPTQPPTITTQPPTATTMVATTPSSTSVSSLPQDVVHFVSETYPDGTNVAPGTTLTKTWTLQNTGTITWTTSYSLVMTEASYPLGESVDHPSVISIPHDVKTGETVEISVNITAPKTDSIYEVHYKLKNANEQFVLGDGQEVWFKLAVGNVSLGTSSVNATNISMQLMEVQKDSAITTVEICAQWPDTQDWNPGNVMLTAGNTQAGPSAYMLKNPKDPDTYASSYRCFFLEFPVGLDNFANEPIEISIGKIHVPVHDFSDCPDVKPQLVALYPGLDFTCGPVGFFYTNLKLPADMSTSEADKIIMDALEQAIYDNWTLTE